jgi:hypothetical protein
MKRLNNKNIAITYAKTTSAGIVRYLKRQYSNLHFTLLKRKCLKSPQLRIYLSVIRYAKPTTNQ